MQQWPVVPHINTHMCACPHMNTLTWAHPKKPPSIFIMHLKIIVNIILLAFVCECMSVCACTHMHIHESVWFVYMSASMHVLTVSMWRSEAKFQKSYLVLRQHLSCFCFSEYSRLASLWASGQFSCLHLQSCWRLGFHAAASGFLHEFPALNSGR